VRVTGWSIEGFGVLSSHVVRDLPGGLVVFEGPNEAGKSTLLAFIRGVLFGFPRAGRGRPPLYPPLSGGRHGGRIFLETAAGEITVEREVGRPPRITLGDGSSLSDSEFERLIGGVDAQTFRTVFAFSLDELSDFASLTGEQVRSRIFAAGVGGAGPSVRQVVQDLEKASGQLLKPRARDAVVNSLLAELAETDRALREARVLAQGYPQLLEEEAGLRARLEDLDRREDRTRSQIEACERLLELWPVWVGLEGDRAQLESLEQVEEFVPDPVRRLAETKQALEKALDDVARAEEHHARRASEVGERETRVRPELQAVAPGVEKQLGLLPFYRDRAHEAATAVLRVRAGEERLRGTLSELGLPADEEALAAIDTTLPRIEEIRQWRVEAAQALGRVAHAVDRLDTATVQRKRAELERDRLKRGLGSEQPPDEAALDARARGVRTLRAGLAELRSLQAARDAHSAGTETTRRLMSAGDGRAPGGAPGVGSTVPGVAAGFVFLIAAVVLLVLGQTVPAVISFALLVLVGATTWAARGRRAGGDYAAAGEVARVLGEQEAEEARLRAAIDELEVGLTAAASAVGLDRLPDLRELEEIDAGVSGQLQASVRWKDRTAEVQRAEERLQEMVVAEEGLHEQAERARNDAESVEKGFADRLPEWGLPSSLTTEGAEEYLRAVAAAKDVLHRLTEDRGAVGRLGEEMSAWERETAVLLEKAGMPASAESEPALVALSDSCRKEVEAQRELKALRETVEESGQEVERARAEAATRRERWDALLREAGVTEENEFLKRYEAFEAGRRLRERIAEGEGALVKRLGKGPDADALLAMLATGAVEEWEERTRSLDRQLEGLKEERAELIKFQGDAERRRAELEESSDVPGLETAVEGIKTELSAALRRWRVHTLAAALVRDTLSEFTRERQPLVLAEASRMFALLSGGRYERVQRSTDDEGIVVVDGAGRTKTPEELSRGTAEQLYLCLRLGLAEEFSRRAEPIPLVMDDVLVNFDPARRRATAGIVHEFAKSHQMLFFTCHPDIERLLSEGGPDVRVVKMG